MKISMHVEFQILKNEGKDFIAVKHDQMKDVSIGGYVFVVDGKSVPFDWVASFGQRCQEDGRFEFSTGRGGYFNDYEIPNDLDEKYKNLGIKREEISAEFLARASSIEEFRVYFRDKGSLISDDCSAGNIEDNSNPYAEYRIKLLDVLFEDVETGKEYIVDPMVLRAFNQGMSEKTLSHEEDKNEQHPKKFYRRGDQIVSMPRDLDSRIREYASCVAKDKSDVSDNTKDHTEREV